MKKNTPTCSNIQTYNISQWKDSPVHPACIPGSPPDTPEIRTRLVSQVSFWGKRDWQMASTVGLWLLRGKCTKVTLPLAAPSQWLRRKDTTMAGSFLWHTLPLWLGTLAWEKLSPHPNQSHQTVLRLHYNLRSSFLFLFFFFAGADLHLRLTSPIPSGSLLSFPHRHFF